MEITTMEQAVQFMAGISLLLVGLSYLLRADDWKKWLTKAEKDGRHASLVFGSINVLIGSFIVAFHHVWEGIPLILTIIGIIAVFKGAVYILFPQWLPTKLKYLSKNIKPILRVSGLILAVIGVLLLREACPKECKDNWSPNLVRSEAE